ncbi:fimbrial biogenesis chaperone [Serratia marcescens]|uniref:fimbrial biogenesis chaperone n=1 Tax=Serratia marcescens TaxID=615 RepID=UPI00217C08BF|nr:molecular chaperone [Serratia marcescens]CAI1616097.1 Chaperone protein fimC precursor [Serratia marcescens]
MTIWAYQMLVFYRKTIVFLLLIGGLILSISNSMAGVRLSQSRIVYMQGTKAESIAAINSGDGAYLVQSGVSASLDGQGEAPFWVMPPILRLNGQSRSLVQIVAKPETSALPGDRESVFYFYTNMIPSTTKPAVAGGGDTAVMKIGIKMLLKLFYRPKGLSIPASKTVDMLKFTRRGNDIVVRNPTPYYASFSSLSFDNKSVDLNNNPSMVAPFGESVFHGNKIPHTIGWALMDDYGSTTGERHQVLSTAE